ncbi:Hypothetical protein D9617_19g103600 [Elsinoe fawcettii]|nr:Hypothetical protein D9617_19g103600 [Elsinoe fawcettii]
MSSNHALVFGASGITGWPVVNAILEGYPTPDSFAKVTALSNRLLKLEDTLWPVSDKLQLASGIDLVNSSVDKIKADLQAKIPGIENVTHVFFNAYVADWDPEKEVPTNRDLLENSIIAVEALATNLQFVVLPTGTKRYGINLIHDFPFFPHQPPLTETDPLIPEPFASKLFYYAQLDVLRKLSDGRNWSFATVMPDVITGYVPNGNWNCAALAVSQFLSLVREVEGEGATLVFPGGKGPWTAQSQDSSQDLIARFSIYAALHPEKTAGQDFNIGVSAEPSSWEVKWPQVCSYFGLKGAPPKDVVDSLTLEGEVVHIEDMSAYIEKHADCWSALAQREGLRTKTWTPRMDSWHMLPGILQYLHKDRQVSMERTHGVWGDMKEETDVAGSWLKAFDRFRRAKVIP